MNTDSSPSSPSVSVAIVTGAAQGIGSAYAKALAAQGHAVVVCDIQDCSPVVEAIEAAGGKAMGCACDVTEPASVRAMVDRTIERYGRIDILVNNAAIFGNITLKPFLEITSEEWDKMMAVNVRGTFECIKAVAPHMKARRYGKIVNIASGTVFKGAPMMLHYVSSKGAIVAMTRSLARELGDDGILVNTLAPGLVLSENVIANNSFPPSAVNKTTATRAIKRDARPDDIVGSLLYLCSPASDFVTGQVLLVDGGAVMH